MANLDSLKKKKREILRRIELTEARKKEALKRSLDKETTEKWLDYYNDYIKVYKKHLDICENEIKKQKPEQKTVYILIFSILIVSILIFISLFPVIKPISLKIKDVGGKISVSLEKIITPEVKEAEKIPEKAPEVAPTPTEIEKEFEEPKVPVVLEDKTVSIKEESLLQYRAVLGKAVKWKKQFTTDSFTGFSVELPKNSENVKIKKIENGKEEDITDLVDINEKGVFRKRVEVEINKNSITGKAIADNSDSISYEIEYETRAPEISELEIEGRAIKKVLIKGPDDVHYKNILSFTQLPRELTKNEIGKLKLYEIRNGQRIATEFIAYDTNENNLFDFIEWITPYLSEAVYELVIEISKAEHLDENKEFISDIYNDVKELDSVWSEPIPAGHYIRVTFKQKLTSKNDITIYPRIISGEPRIEVYEMNGEEVIAEFESLIGNEYNKVLLTNLKGQQDVFDLRVVDGSVEIEHIVDPVEETILSSITGEASDGYIYGKSDGYAEAWTTSYSYDKSYVLLSIGQHYWTSDDIYNVYRVYLDFDTSSIPDTAKVTDVKLSLNVGGDYSSPDFNISIYDFNWQEPIGTGNREANYDAVGAVFDNFWRSTAGISERIYYNSSSLNNAWINLTGDTKYQLRSDRDVRQIEPTGKDQIDIYSGDSYEPESGKPILHVTYVVPIPTVTILSPLNNSNFSVSSVTFNVSLSEAGSWCGLSISGAANKTMTLNASKTGASYTTSLISIENGNHSFIVSCNDTANSFGYSSTYYFLVDTDYVTVVTAVTGEASDGDITGQATTYSIARSTASGSSTTSNWLRVGQRYNSGYTNPYNVHRTYLDFDTSSIPDNAVVTDVKLNLKLCSNVPSTTFNVLVYDFSWEEPISSSNMESNYDAVGAVYDAIWRDTTGLYYGQRYNSSSLNNNWVNLIGNTKYQLRSKRDVDNIEPEDYEYIEVCSTELVGDKPILYVTYKIDITPPTVTITGIGGDTSSLYSTSDTSPTVTATTNENADCRASIDGDETYDQMADDIDCTGDGTTSHTCQFGTLSESASTTFYVACNDSVGNKNSAANNGQAVAEIDASPPTQSGHNPANNSVINTNSPTITFTTNENADCRASLTDESYDQMSNDIDCTGDGGTSQTCVMSGLSEGAEIVYIACRDDTNVYPNNDTAAANEHVYYTVDTISPLVTILNPANNSNFNISSITFNVSLNEAGSWCGLSISGVANKTMTLNASKTGAGYTNSSIGNGNYNFIVSCNDSANNFGYSGTYYFLVDTVYPSINFTAPTPSNSSSQSATSIFVNVSASDSVSNISTFIDFDNSLVGWWRMDDVKYVEAGYVYQETGGAYACEGNWNLSYPCTNTYDGNYNTAGYCGSNPSDTCYLYVNYTKPLGAQSGRYYHTVTPSSSGSSGIPSDCWSRDILQFVYNLSQGSTYFSYGCWNGTGWKFSGFISGSYTGLKEEYVNWSISKHTEVIDYTGRNNGTAVGNAKQTDAGKLGKGFEFDRINSVITIDNTAGNVPLGNFSISAWFKASSVFPMPDDYYIISQSSYCSPNTTDPQWILDIANDVGYMGELTFYNTLSGANKLYSGVNVTDNKWHHAGLVRNSTSLSIYVDGVLRNSQGDYFAGQIRTSSVDIEIGGLSCRSQENFNGTIDDVIIFNRSLSADEIRGLYANKSSEYLTHDFTDLKNGNYTFKAYVQDTAGNVNSTELRSVSISPLIPPQIIWVQNIPNVDLDSGRMKNISFNFTVYDGNGWQDLNDSSARANFTKGNVVRNSTNCSKIVGWDNYANYSCIVGMWYFDEAGFWNVTVAIKDNSEKWAVNDTTYFRYNEGGYFSILPFPTYINWSNVSLGGPDKPSDNNITIRNLGNKNILNVSINATQFNGTQYTGYNINVSYVRVNISSSNFCNGYSLKESQNVTFNLFINYSESSEIKPASEDLGFCMKTLTGIPVQVYKSARDWLIDVEFGFILYLIKVSEIVLAVAAVSIKSKKKKPLGENKSGRDKWSLGIKEKLKDKYIDFNGLLNLDSSLRGKYGLGLDEILEIAKREKVEEKIREEIQVPIFIFKQEISPTEVLCKYLKENLGLRFSEIARLINRDERTIWINYRNAVKKKKEKIKTEKKVLISVNVGIFSDRRLSVLESVVKYLKEKGLRNVEVAKLLGKDQRNIYTLYSRVKRKLA